MTRDRGEADDSDDEKNLSTAALVAVVSWRTKNGEPGSAAVADEKSCASRAPGGEEVLLLLLLLLLPVVGAADDEEDVAVAAAAATEGAPSVVVIGAGAAACPAEAGTGDEGETAGSDESLLSDPGASAS